MGGNRNKRIVTYRLYILTILLLSTLLISCSNNEEEYLFEIKENWGELQVGENKSIHYTMRVYKKGKDTIYYTTNYYSNGIVKCKTIHINDCLDRVEFVNDTNGESLDYGKVQNGNGYVKKYNNQGILEYSGKYSNGNKEGWWLFYRFNGDIIDSSFYEKGINQNNEDIIWFGNTGQLKDNLYD